MDEHGPTQTGTDEGEAREEPITITNLDYDDDYDDDYEHDKKRRGERVARYCSLRDGTAARAWCGFTLLELLLVLTLLAVLSAVAVPKLSGSLRSARLKEGAADLAAVVREGRKEAVRRGLSVKLSVDRKQSSYRLRLLDPVHSYEEGFVDFGDPLLDTCHFLPAGVSFAQTGSTTSRPEELTFSPGGVGESCTLEIEDKSGARMKLELGTWYEDLTVTRVEDATGRATGTR